MLLVFVFSNFPLGLDDSLVAPWHAVTEVLEVFDVQLQAPQNPDDILKASEGDGVKRLNRPLYDMPLIFNGTEVWTGTRPVQNLIL